MNIVTENEKIEETPILISDGGSVISLLVQSTLLLIAPAAAWYIFRSELAGSDLFLILGFLAIGVATFGGIWIAAPKFSSVRFYERELSQKIVFSTVKVKYRNIRDFVELGTIRDFQNYRIECVDDSGTIRTLYFKIHQRYKDGIAEVRKHVMAESGKKTGESG
ncbi:MAG: hypothetical protein NUW37_09695 [Planctomycetes bacterium]|nr:hypothetical protein [Planctomycetota bacterium]